MRVESNAPTAVESDELYLAQTEIRHLKDTIRALREELEKEQAGREDAVQAAVAASLEEIRQLREMIQSLREQLEALLASKEQAVQAVVATSHNEARQLQATIGALRGELEQLRGR